MLKKRVVAVVVVKDGLVVQSLGFKRYLPVGRPAVAIEFLSRWGADEIVLLDISASRRGNGPDFDSVRRAAEKCRVPLAVGGGITNIRHIGELIRWGADKVCINHALFEHFDLVPEAAAVFGSQCIIASLDVCKQDSYRIYDHVGGGLRAEDPILFAQRLQEAGAGEILVNCVDRDGARQGFDIDFLANIAGALSIPVIGCGGAGHAKHFSEVFYRTGVSGAAAANMFHYTEHSVIQVKAQVGANAAIRNEAAAQYRDNPFGVDGRLAKKDDEVLEDMRFIRIEKEVI